MIVSITTMWNRIDLGFPIGLDEEITEFISHACVQLESGHDIVLY